jgi:hypothetical protein
VVPEATDVVPIYLALAPIVFILPPGRSRQICQKVHLWTVCTKPADTQSRKQKQRETNIFSFQETLLFEIEMGSVDP